MPYVVAPTGLATLVFGAVKLIKKLAKWLRDMIIVLIIIGSGIKIPFLKNIRKRIRI